MVRVLHIAMGSGAFGGAARFAINYYRHIDKNNIVFDFLFCNKNSLGLLSDDPLLSKSRIFELGVLSDNNNVISYLRLIRSVKKIIRKEKYEIVHIDTGSLPIQICCLVAAKMENVKVRIAHSHSAGENKTKNSLNGYFKKCFKPVMQFMIRFCATDYFACSIAAGDNLFGDGCEQLSKFRLVSNAIDTSNFEYNANMRNKIRESLNIKSTTKVFGHVGRFDKVKNHLFLIDIYDEICRNAPDSLLLLVGDGPENKKILERINRSPFKDSIILLGERNDVNHILQGMDLFFLPSFYEGLSIVAIEAQCSGLPVFASDSISKEHDVTGNVVFMSLNASAKEWAMKALRYIDFFVRKNEKEALVNSGYEITQEARKLEKLYINSEKTS